MTTAYIDNTGLSKQLIFKLIYILHLHDNLTDMSSMSKNEQNIQIFRFP